jgi:hypothetical protein
LSKISKPRTAALVATSCGILLSGLAGCVHGNAPKSTPDEMTYGPDAGEIQRCKYSSSKGNRQVKIVNGDYGQLVTSEAEPMDQIFFGRDGRVLVKIAGEIVYDANDALNSLGILKNVRSRLRREKPRFSAWFDTRFKEVGSAGCERESQIFERLVAIGEELHIGAPMIISATPTNVCLPVSGTGTNLVRVPNWARSTNVACAEPTALPAGDKEIATLRSFAESTVTPNRNRGKPGHWDDILVSVIGPIAGWYLKDHWAEWQVEIGRSGGIPEPVKQAWEFACSTAIDSYNRASLELFPSPNEADKATAFAEEGRRHTRIVAETKVRLVDALLASGVSLVEARALVEKAKVSCWLPLNSPD